MRTYVFKSTDCKLWINNLIREESKLGSSEEARSFSNEPTCIVNTGNLNSDSSDNKFNDLNNYSNFKGNRYCECYLWNTPSDCSLRPRFNISLFSFTFYCYSKKFTKILEVLPFYREKSKNKINFKKKNYIRSIICYMLILINLGIRAPLLVL